MFFIETGNFNSSHSSDNNQQNSSTTSTTESNQAFYQNDIEFEDYYYNAQYQNTENSSSSSNSSFQSIYYNYPANESNQSYFENNCISRNEHSNNYYYRQEEWATRGNNTRIDEYQNNKFYAYQESELLIVSTQSVKNKRKRVLNRIQRQEATVREKRRMLKLNTAFEQLRCALPLSEATKEKISRVDTLKSAMDYIDEMVKILTTC